MRRGMLANVYRGPAWAAWLGAMQQVTGSTFGARDELIYRAPIISLRALVLSATEHYHPRTTVHESRRKTGGQEQSPQPSTSDIGITNRPTLQMNRNQGARDTLEL